MAGDELLLSIDCGMQSVRALTRLACSFEPSAANAALYERLYRRADQRM